MGFFIGAGGSSGASAIQYINIREEQVSGTDGGTFTSGAYRTRVLNTIVLDDTGVVLLAANQFTLPAGTYNILARVPSFRVDRVKAKLRNITDATDEIVGTNHINGSLTNGNSDSWVIGQFTIAASKVFEIQHRCQTTEATIGLGNRTTFGEIEVFTEVWLEKIA